MYSSPIARMLGRSVELLLLTEEARNGGNDWFRPILDGDIKFLSFSAVVKVHLIDVELHPLVHIPLFD